VIRRPISITRATKLLTNISHNKFMAPFCQFVCPYLVIKKYVTIQDPSPPVVALPLMCGPWGSLWLPHGPHIKNSYEAPQALRSQEGVT